MTLRCIVLIRLNDGNFEFYVCVYVFRWITWNWIILLINPTSEFFFNSWPKNIRNLAAELAAKKTRVKQSLIKRARSVAIFSLKLKERRAREAEKQAYNLAEQEKVNSICWATIRLFAINWPRYQPQNIQFRITGAKSSTRWRWIRYDWHWAAYSNRWYTTEQQKLIKQHSTATQYMDATYFMSMETPNAIMRQRRYMNIFWYGAQTILIAITHTHTHCVW